jgi:hypothetical protein
VRTLQQPLLLQIGNVFVHRGQRLETQAASNFLKGRGVSIALDEVADEVEDFFLPAGYRHFRIIANKKRTRKDFFCFCLWLDPGGQVRAVRKCLVLGQYRRGYPVMRLHSNYVFSALVARVNPMQGRDGTRESGTAQALAELPNGHWKVTGVKVEFP